MIFILHKFVILSGKNDTSRWNETHCTLSHFIPNVFQNHWGQYNTNRDQGPIYTIQFFAFTFYASHSPHWRNVFKIPKLIFTQKYLGPFFLPFQKTSWNSKTSKKSFNLNNYFYSVKLIFVDKNFLFCDLST